MNRYNQVPHLTHPTDMILNLPFLNGIVSSTIYNIRDGFSFKWSFLDEDGPRFPSCGVYISQLIRFARACSNVRNTNF